MTRYSRGRIRGRAPLVLPAIHGSV